MSKVLISTAWWPTKTKWFNRWSSSISSLLNENTELFITTKFSDTKYSSIVGAMSQAQSWAEAHGFTHIFNVEADKELQSNVLSVLLSRNKPVVLIGDGSGKLVPFTYNELDAGYGWGSMLVNVSVLQSVPFSVGSVAGMITPDRVWFKRLLQLNTEILIDHSCTVNTLEPASHGPQGCFNPDRRSQ